MSVLRVTLLCDGPYDEELLHPIRWLLHTKQCHLDSLKVADLQRVNPKPTTLRERADTAVDLYPCQILFVHRDSERTSPHDRLSEIRTELHGVSYCYIPIIPVRMTEAWFLHSEEAIRGASGNPNGTAMIEPPRPQDVSTVANPKDYMSELLIKANGASGRRLKKVRQRLPQMRRIVAQWTDCFQPLLENKEFRGLSEEIDGVLARICGVV